MTSECCPLCNTPRRKEPDGSFSSFSVSFAFVMSNTVTLKDQYGHQRDTSFTTTEVKLEIDPESMMYRVVQDGVFRVSDSPIQDYNGISRHKIECSTFTEMETRTYTGAPTVFVSPDYRS